MFYCWWFFSHNFHRCQAAAARERIKAYACHAVWDGHRGQAAATIERIRAYACHAVGDGH